jgi:hypothetical protein
MMFTTCKEVTRLASDSLERDLFFGEYTAMQLHLWACQPCRRYVRQLNVLKHAAEEVREELPSRATLSTAARERIRKRLVGEE